MTVRRPEDSDRRIVLTGVADIDGKPTAFFESTQTGETITVRVGDPVGKGTLKAILMDAVEYDREGTTRRIQFGLSLAGTSGAVLIRREPYVPPVAPSSEAPDAEEPAEPSEATIKPSEESPAPSTGDSDINAILEQMRRRREQELRR